jgi:hypothetical protein
MRTGLVERFFSLPRKGTPASELTDHERVALAIAAGAPYRLSFEDGEMRVATAVQVGFADRGDGGWIVAIGPS